MRLLKSDMSDKMDIRADVSVLMVPSSYLLPTGKQEHFRAVTGMTESCL